MNDVKRNMPVNPIFAEKPTQPALVVRATDPNLPSWFQDTADVSQHLSRIERMFQDIGKHGHVEERSRSELVQRRGVYSESLSPSDRGGHVVQFKSFHREAILGVDR